MAITFTHQPTPEAILEWYRSQCRITHIDDAGVSADIGPTGEHEVCLVERLLSDLIDHCREQGYRVESFEGFRGDHCYVNGLAVHDSFGDEGEDDSSFEEEESIAEHRAMQLEEGIED